MAGEFEAAHRAAKVAALLAEIDRLCIKSRVDPYANSAEIATFVSKWTHEQWAKLAIQAGKRPPSQTTRDQVIAMIAARAMPRIRLVTVNGVEVAS